MFQDQMNPVQTFPLAPTEVQILPTCPLDAYYVHYHPTIGAEYNPITGCSYKICI